MAIVPGLSPADAILELHELGFCGIPLRPQQKRPLEKWEIWQKQRPSAEQTDLWVSKYPGCNWGIVCGAVSGLVIVDCDSEDALEWALANLPPTPWRVRTGRGAHLYFKYPFGREAWLKSLGRLREGVDLLADGHYAVAPCSVHPSGKVYTPEFSGEWEDVPEFDLPHEGPRRAENLRDALRDLDLSQTDETFSPAGEGDRHPLIRSRVAVMVNRGLGPREALREARRLNRDMCSPPLPDEEVSSIVEGLFKKDVAGRRREAAERAAELELDVSDPLADNPWPERVLNPGGILGRIMDYTMGCSPRTERVYALANGIFVLGALLGQRVRTESGLITNMYCMAVGPSASGKDAPKRASVALLEAVAPGLFAGSDISSDVAILSYLKDWHRAALVLDEIGILLKSTKRPNSPRYLVVKALTDFSTVYKNAYRKIYADQKLNICIDWLSISILGMSVPEEYFGALQDGESTNGWLARNLVFEHRGPLREKNYDNVGLEIPEDLVEDLKAIWAIDGGDSAVVLTKEGAVQTAPSPADPHVVPMAPEAMAYHRAKDSAMEAVAHEADKAGRKAEASIRFRAAELAWKVALILAASRLGAAVVDGRIEIEDVELAWELLETETARRCGRVNESIFASDFDAVMQEVREAIRRYRRREKSKGGNSEKPGAPESYIYRTVRSVPSDVLKKAIDHMVKANELALIEWRSSEKSRRTMELYCLVREKEEC